MFCLTCFAFVITSNPEIKACPDVGFNNVVRIIIVVLFPAPLGPKNPKISPFLTEREISLTAVTSPNDFVSDFSSIEYNELIAFSNYKLLSIDSVDPHKKFKGQFENLLYERTLPEMSLIKCRNNSSRRNSCLCNMY